MDGERMPNTDGAFSIRIDDIMIDCPDAGKLGDFYAGLLGWNKTVLNRECVAVHAENQPVNLICQQEEDYIPPVWPEAENRQQKMLHLDFTVSDLKTAVEHARALGAVMAGEQYNPGQWITLLDPAGHPFCLCLPE
jgi:predicted enzyme related to lactoylglutathione lyase